MSGQDQIVLLDCTICFLLQYFCNKCSIHRNSSPIYVNTILTEIKDLRCRLLFCFNGRNDESLIQLLHGFRVSKPIENHPVYYTLQNVFSNSLLVDKPICIRAGSLFLTIHLLDRRHYFVVESNQVSLA